MPAASFDDVLERTVRALSFTAQRFAIIAGQLNDAIDKLSAVLALVEQARKISPSPTMCLYVTDVERALGLTDTAAPHKLGQADA